MKPRWLEHTGYVLVIAFGAFVAWKCGPWCALMPTGIGLTMVRVFLTDAWEKGLK